MKTVLPRYTSWLLAAGLVTLLLILASLQYRWLDEVSRANRERSRDLLQDAVARFAEDFDRELTRAFLYLQPRPADGPHAWDDRGFAGRYERWRTYAPFPDLVRDVYRARRTDGDVLEITRFDPEQGVFSPAPWPTELEGLQSHLAAARRWPRRGERRDGPDGFSFLAEEIPALILPMSLGGPPGGGPPGEGRRSRFRREAFRGAPAGGPRRSERRPGEERPGGPPSSGGWGLVVAWLDLDTLRDVILPRLSEQHLNGGDGIEYQARVLTLGDPPQVVFRRGEAPGTDASRAGDATAGLFGLLPPDKLGPLELEAGRVTSESTEPTAVDSRRRGRRLREDFLYRRIYGFISTEARASSDSLPGRWRLVASHPAGSLDAAVATAHRRNLGISFGILLLLGVSLMLMWLSTRRLQALARQQLEFVAGVTHELLTPLAAMRSAGQNLADGVVEEPQKVRRYGRLVEDEGRRLSTMVEQVLEFAGIQVGRRSYALERTQLGAIVDAAVAEYASVLEDKGVRLEKRLESDLPDVMADALALRRAVQNLIANAIKYGTRQEAWIGLRVVVGDGPGGRELQLSVEDKGPGIATADRARLFEPFYRGRDGASDAAPGSGLGLSLVKHIAEGHGGRVSVATEEGAGSTFTLHLPAITGAGSQDEEVR